MADFRRRGLAVARDRVVLTASTSEAYSLLFKLLCNPGDEVLVPVPSYPLFEDLAALDSVQVRPYRLDYHGTWTVDLDGVKRATRERTRAVIVVNPNNPTGSYLKRHELDALARTAAPTAWRSSATRSSRSTCSMPTCRAPARCSRSARR